MNGWIIDGLIEVIALCHDCFTGSFPWWAPWQEQQAAAAEEAAEVPWESPDPRLFDVADGGVQVGGGFMMANGLMIV